MNVDPRAATGFAEVSAVDAYERGRPSYPVNTIANVVRELGLTSASAVLDLGAGTGKLSRLLLPLVGRVIAVEPSEAMLAELRERLPGADARVGSAEAIPLADESVDAVFVGEAFHWFRTAEACREIARVSSGEGGLALLWNRARWTERELPWLGEFETLVKPFRAAAGPFPADEGRWKPALEQTGLFAPLAHAEVDHAHRSSADAFIALVRSWSWIANLPAQQRRSLLSRVRELVGDQPHLTLRYRTETYWTRLL